MVKNYTSILLARDHPNFIDHSPSSSLWSLKEFLECLDGASVVKHFFSFSGNVDAPSKHTHREAVLEALVETWPGYADTAWGRGVVRMLYGKQTTKPKKFYGGEPLVKDIFDTLCTRIGDTGNEGISIKIQLPSAYAADSFPFFIVINKHTSWGHGNAVYTDVCPGYSRREIVYCVTGACTPEAYQKIMSVEPAKPRTS